MKIDLVVTRHAGIVEYLIQEGIVAPDVKVLKELDITTISPDMVNTASAEAVTRKNVLGVAHPDDHQLPYHLTTRCESFTEIRLNLPPEMRGKELTAEDVRQYAGIPVTYRVRSMFVHYKDEPSLFGREY